MISVIKNIIINTNIIVKLKYIERSLKMIVVEENNINEVWKSSLEKLYKNGYIPQDSRFFRMDTLIIEINEPKLCSPDILFPVLKNDIDIINNFIITGKNEEKVCHEWTKLYYHRLFDNPNSQIEYMIERIKKNRVGIACNWIKDDQHAKIKPCMLSVTCNNENGKLNFQLHARACNIYNKLLMNLQEFIAIQKYIALRCDLNMGRFTMFIDYAQISQQDKAKVENIVSRDY